MEGDGRYSFDFEIEIETPGCLICCTGAAFCCTGAAFCSTGAVFYCTGAIFCCTGVIYGAYAAYAAYAAAGQSTAQGKLRVIGRFGGPNPVSRFQDLGYKIAISRIQETGYYTGYRILSDVCSLVAPLSRGRRI